MKKRFLAMLLALVLVLGMMPADAFAAAPVRKGTMTVEQPQSLQPQALPEKPAETQGDHKITLKVTSGSSHGEVELTASSADAGDTVPVYINPDPGYLAEIEYSYEYYYYEAEMYYAGADVYALVMGDGKVDITVKFVKAPGENHTITVKTTGNGSGTAEVNVTSAKEGESVLLACVPDFGCFRGGIWTSAFDIYELGEIEGVEYFEFFMPGTNAELTVEFGKTGPYHLQYILNDFSAYIYQNRAEDETCTIETSAWEFFAMDTITVTIRPKTGYKLEMVEFSNYLELKQLNENQWEIVSGDREPHVTVRTAPAINPVSLVLDSTFGGTASLDVAEAQEGTTVALTCIPEEGYRVARILGAEVTDNGDNTYTFTMPGHAVELHVLFLREDNPFLDVTEDRFFYDSVMWAVERGIIQGMTADTFCPFEYCNRAQLVTLLWRAAGCPEPETTESPFTDVPEGKWYTKAVLWAVENGIVEGMGNGTFDLNGTCNRAQAITILWRLRGRPAAATAEHPFTDVPDQSWYKAAVLWGLENGIITGTTATTFDPAGKCMRAMIATLLYRTAQLPEAEPLVSDARYALLRAEDATVYGCYHLPKLNVVGAEAFNETLNRELNAIIDEGQELLMGLHYTWNTEGNVVAILSQLKLDWDVKVFYGHYADITTGAALTKGDLLAACGLEEETFAAACREAMLAWLTAQYAESPLFEELKASTLTEENIAACIPFLDENGELCIAAGMASPAGADSYWHLLDLQGNELPYLTCTETHA